MFLLYYVFYLFFHRGMRGFAVKSSISYLITSCCYSLQNYILVNEFISYSHDLSSGPCTADPATPTTLKTLPMTLPLNLTLPMCRMAARTLVISHTSESLNIRTFMAERMSANSRASSRPSHVMLPPWGGGGD